MKIESCAVTSAAGEKRRPAISKARREEKASSHLEMIYG